jgi:4-amino-4-deoxy-L-arabinose transferase-like glycosyltransferase
MAIKSLTFYTQKVETSGQALAANKLWVWLFIIACSCFISFYKIGVTPLAWHDEGSAMLISKTLVQDGVYSVKTTTGYESFGPVQSVGPTVLLPIALVFKLFGVGIVQGRVIASIYLVFTLLAFYAITAKLFGHKVALLGFLLLLGNPNARMILQGREVLGEVPALGFIFLGALLFYQGLPGRNIKKLVLSGLLIGASMVTKNSNTFIGFVTLFILFVLDLIYYKKGYYIAIIITGLAALFCVLVWFGWQWVYYGQTIFLENFSKFSQLAKYTTGFSLRNIYNSFTLLIRNDQGSFYYFWGFAAILYSAVLSIRNDRKGFATAFLFLFSMLWLGYYFYSVPWRSYICVTAAITAIFVAKLWVDLFGIVFQQRVQIADLFKDKESILKLGGQVGLLVALGFMVFYPLQTEVKSDLSGDNSVQKEIVTYLESNISKNDVIETWDRELPIMTDLQYHYPDQMMLAKAHYAIYRNGPSDYGLGEKYFQEVKPAYIITGWFSRWTGVYDQNYLDKNTCLIKSIGDGENSYQIYKLNNSSVTPCQ